MKDIVSKLDEIKALVNEQAELERKLAIYSIALLKNDIYLIAFDSSSRIIFQNYPSIDHAQSLQDFSFLLGEQNITLLSSLLSSNVQSLDQLKLTYNELAFNLTLVEPELWYIQVESEKQESQPQTDDFHHFQALAQTFTELNSWREKGSIDEFIEQINSEHLPKIRDAKAQIQDPILKMCLDIVENSVVQVTDSDAGVDAKLYELLTPSEVQIAKFIRMGLSTSEIAHTLSIAGKTVENHRNSLRNKLGLTNKGVNLRNYLVSLKEG